MSNEQAQGVGSTPEKSNKSTNSYSEFVVLSDESIPSLREFIRPDEDDDTSIRLPARDGRRIGMLTIPDIQYQAWKTLFPQGMEKGPQSRYRQSRRVIFAIDDLPADAPTSINTGEASVFFSGFHSPIPAGEWIGNPPAELPVVTYADITRLVGTRVDPQEPAPTTSTEGSPDGSGIPQELKNANQWLVWKFGERDGKKTKIPLNPKTLTNTSAPEAAWSYEECKEAADRQSIGIGFSLKNGFVGIDYDHVLDTDGNLKPEYAGLMEEIQALSSYTEVSPSGEGLHVFVRCEDIPPECKAGKHTERGETYSSGRYFTVTGKVWKVSPNRNINTIHAELYRRVYNRIAGTQDNGKEAPQEIQRITATPKVVRTDAEVIFIIQKSPKGKALWAGDTSGYESPSNADEALMVMLADITGGNKWQMMQLFLSSGLGKREKAGRPDYISRTAEKACEYVTKNKKPAPPVTVYEDDDEPDEPEEDTYDYEAEDAAIESLLNRAPAPFRAVIDFYNATSPIPQPAFAIGAAITAAEEICGRNFQTGRLSFDGGQTFPPIMTNDYHAFIAPTGCGKDAIKGFLEAVIDNEHIPIVSSASGSTAIHTKLQQYPRTVIFNDEAGRSMSEAGRDPSGLKQSAETYAMMIYGNIGKISPQTFSDTKDSPLLKYFNRHGLVVIRTSTPETFAGAVTYDYVRDGWLPRQNITVSYRPRPKELGEYCPDGGAKYPTILLTAWNAWRLVHIGMPEADTYHQSVNPITAVVWGGTLPEEYRRAAKQMRNRACQYWTDIETWKDTAITIGWENEAGREIARIYAEIEAVPPDDYTPMRRRKLVHIKKTALTIALLSDGITWSDLMKIYQKYAGTESGAAILQEEAEKKKAFDIANREYDAAKRLKDSEANKSIKQDAYTAYTKAEEEYKRIHSLAEAKVRMPIRREAAERFAKIRITAEDVKWAYDYINLIETGAKRLIEEEINDIGFTPAIEAAVSYLEKHGGNATETKIIEKCSAVRKLDQRLYLKAFCEYAEDTGRVVIMKTGRRGRRWYLPAKTTGTEGDTHIIHKTP